MVKAPEIGAKGAAGQVQVAQAEAPDFEKVHWRQEPHLRKLYAFGFIKRWGEYFPEVGDKHKLGILVNMFNIGSIISFFVTPYVADKWGRKFAITLGCLIMCVGGCLSAFANSYEMFIAGRFVLGFGNSFAQMCSPLLLTEICHPQHRGPVTAIYNCLWNLGALIVSCIGWGTSTIENDWSWRTISFIQVVPSAIQLIFIYWIPESPRFLLSKDRTDEALEMLATYYAGGDKNNATVQYEFQEIKETMRIDRLTNRAAKYSDFFKKKGNRWRLAIIISLGVISQYSGSAILSNYINVIYEGAGVHNQNQKLGITTGRTILDLSVTIAAALCVDRFGRRPLFLISISGMVVAFVCWIITSAVYENSDLKNSGAGYAQLVFIWIFGIFYDIGWSGLLVAYALEVLLFHLRAKGMMIMNITVQAILALSKFVIPNPKSLLNPLTKPQPNKPSRLGPTPQPVELHVVLHCTPTLLSPKLHPANLPSQLWDACELVFVYFFYVETNGPTLEQIAKIFDGEDAATAHIDLHQVEKEIAQAQHEDDIVEVQAASLKGAA
ncbi:hypothetical protein V493_05895 [Pseudogymnoascus sp. VKM F-4281 (FW-2241)]|nr:hypothetical protein V493_05895 [Pseudogymnoascus sp. VKM F-4281 (FW-2241)]